MRIKPYISSLLDFQLNFLCPSVFDFQLNFLCPSVFFKLELDPIANMVLIVLNYNLELQYHELDY